MKQDYSSTQNWNEKNGWSKTSLIGLSLLLSASAAWAQKSEPSNTDPTLSLDDRTLLYLAGLLLVHAAVPLIRYIWQIKTTKKAYRAFLASNIESAKTRFGDGLDNAEIRSKIPDSDLYDNGWLTLFENKAVNAPELICAMACTIAKRLDGEQKHEKYVPYISYAGMPTADLNHDHPIWFFSKKENAMISKYLLSELQVERSVKDLYSKPLIDLATSDSRQERNRWTNAAFSLVSELSEHYLDVLRLERHLLSTSLWHRIISGKTKRAHESLSDMLGID